MDIIEITDFVTHYSIFGFDEITEDKCLIFSSRKYGDSVDKLPGDTGMRCAKEIKHLLSVCYPSTEVTISTEDEWTILVVKEKLPWVTQELMLF